jgi:hypothetical protein
MSFNCNIFSTEEFRVDLYDDNTNKAQQAVASIVSIAQFAVDFIYD